jgi:hypothetical protein
MGSRLFATRYQVLGRFHMATIPKDEEREQRIHMEIVVDAHDSEEQAI